MNTEFRSAGHSLPSVVGGPPAALALLLAAGLVGCGPGHEPIPSGAQQVHIVITDSEVRLEPATVRVGDVYLVLDAPAQGSFVFVQQKTTAEATPGPLTDDDLALLSTGNSQFTAIEGISAGGCSAEQDAEARGQMGYCGNVFQVTLSEGKYAVLGNGPGNPGDPPSSMAVLEVLP